MKTYRFYFLNAENRIAGPAREIACADDVAAASIATDLLEANSESFAIEIWDADRLVGTHQRTARS